MDSLQVTLRRAFLFQFLVVLIANLCGCSGVSMTPPVIETITKSNVKVVLIPGGEFWMGSDQVSENTSPRHRVKVSPFAMDQYEVLQRELVTLEMPDASHFKGADRPVEQIRWSDAALFCNARSRAEELQPCYDEATFECNFEASGYRLPTEAEWEYAARAGSTMDYPFGKTARKLKNYACYSGNSGKQTSRAGMKKGNVWNLYDMLGNVAEWCHDVYSKTYYGESPPEDPRGPASGPERVLRGGSWKSSPEACSPVGRMSDVPGITDACFAQDSYGFRCVRRLTVEELSRLEENSI